MSSPTPKIETTTQERPPNNEGPTQENPPKKVKKATRSKRWSFYYKSGFAEDRMYEALKVSLYPKDHSSLKIQLKDAIINRLDRHIYVNLTAQVHTGLLKGLPFVIGLSITSCSSLSESLFEDLKKNFPGYEKWNRKQLLEDCNNTDYDKIMDEFIMQQMKREKNPQDENENKLSKQIFQVIYSLANGGSLSDIACKAESSMSVNTTIDPLRSLYQNFEKFCHQHPDENLVKHETNS